MDGIFLLFSVSPLCCRAWFSFLSTLFLWIFWSSNLFVVFLCKLPPWIFMFLFLFPFFAPPPIFFCLFSGHLAFILCPPPFLFTFPLCLVFGLPLLVWFPIHRSSILPLMHSFLLQFASIFFLHCSLSVCQSNLSFLSYIVFRCMLPYSTLSHYLDIYSSIIHDANLI